MQSRIDLVADLGEGFGDWSMGDDAALLQIVSSANVACGFHAGDPRIMDATARACAARGIQIGAHPSFPDLVGFGRRAMDLTADQVRTDVLYQIGALSAFATAHGTRVRHVAPHGRLGNLVAVRADYARAVCDAVEAVDPELIVVAQDGELADESRRRGLAIAIVGIVDRAYQADGTLVPRSQPGAVIHDVDELVARAVQIATESTLEAADGTLLEVQADSLLLHGDNDGAVATARAIRDGLTAAGVTVAPMADVLDAGRESRG